MAGMKMIIPCYSESHSTSGASKIWLAKGSGAQLTDPCKILTLCFFKMSKRSATEVQASSDGQFEPRKTPRSESKRKENVLEDEMGEFEDGWEDEYESDEEVVDGQSGKPEDSTSCTAITLFMSI